MADQQQQQQTDQPDEGDGQTPSHLTMMPRTIGDPNADLGDGDDGEEDDEPGDPDPMQQKLQSLEQQNQQLQENLNQMMLRMSAQPPAQQPVQGGQQQQAPTPEDLKLDDLPDPVDDRQKFNQELGKRIDQYVKGQQQQFQTQNQFQQQLADLDSQFRRNYPDLADKEMLFQASVQQEANKMKQAGLDPRQAAFMQPDKFLQDVASRMRSELGADPDGGGQQQQAAAGGGQKQQPKQKGQGGGRTKGVSGGSSPGNSGKRGSGNQQQPPKGFIDQLKGRQLDDGLI